ncbi:MAG: GntR family transcriptional regulator, transcriptional repressor for pyruvate dehydrogenase complex [Clostridia bacterium]|nr:GntR family transcriptional regulator, transcriptional repressor for pyruvate dehydrogenase complex [Clostridia bacterium]MDN5322659.1 GntR family transcriptional regulator, transcriptional repressor for pyruvate dehydrogenase complex [Clostridia bacterium]
MFSPIKKDPTSVYEKILKELTSAIMHGDLKPGDKLPAERNLAEMMGVSRTSLREALKMLAAQGMVEIKHGQGVFITEKETPTNLLKGFAGQKLLDSNTLKDLFELRKLLETQNAVWVCQRGSDEAIISLTRLVEETLSALQKNKDDLIILAKQDSEFHTKLAEASGNKVIVRVMHDLLDLLNESRCQALSIPERPQKSLNEHKDIVEALKLRDVELVKEKMLTHLTNVEAELLKPKE